MPPLYVLSYHHHHDQHKPSLSLCSFVSDVQPRHKIRIQKRFALSPRLFCKATEMISGVFKSVSPVGKLDILSICLENRINTLKKARINLNKAFPIRESEAQKSLRIQAQDKMYLPLVTSSPTPPPWDYTCVIFN
ncbi:hypothetical protein E2C01_096742 [Portunus trituberculatus]|uniref:Uncharacterized protein n=1 Tax=Portunus trituberculatus TaxID=210409 RepID=A0A5B7K3P7_PORTR|nr:hypothetical protein [Portunus trituberculatus]